MNKKIINFVLFLINVILIGYFIYVFFNPLVYNREFENKKDIAEDEIRIVENSFDKYIEACLYDEKDKIKSMLPLIKKFDIKKYDYLTNLYEENDVTEVDQIIIYNISKVKDNIYQVKFYSKTGNVVNGLLDNTVIIKINKFSKSFRILFDKNLVDRGE